MFSRKSAYFFWVFGCDLENRQNLFVAVRWVCDILKYWACFLLNYVFQCTKHQKKYHMIVMQLRYIVTSGLLMWGVRGEVLHGEVLQGVRGLVRYVFYHLFYIFMLYNLNLGYWYWYVFYILLHFYVVQFKLGLLVYILSSFYIFILCFMMMKII